MASSSCGICAGETSDVPIQNDVDFKYSLGDVYGMNESVYTPIYHILVQTFSSLAGERDALKRSQQSLEELKRFHNADKGCRPAVVMKDSDSRAGMKVCIGATYGKDDISKLPLIFRHFSIPVAFNGSISPNHPNHLHALPEWNRENAYIIAWPFTSTAALDGLWTAHADEESDKVPQVFGRDTMEFLVKECQRRRDEWEKMCKDPEVALTLETQLTDHVRKRWDKKQAGASTTSVNTVGTGVDGMWRRPIPGPPTIPEESDANNAVPGNQPGAWKQVPPKHRTQSIRSASSVFSAFSKKKYKKSDQWDKTSTKSNHSRSSFCHKPSNRGGACNFDLLLAVKQR